MGIDDKNKLLAIRHQSNFFYLDSALEKSIAEPMRKVIIIKEIENYLRVNDAAIDNEKKDRINSVIDQLKKGYCGLENLKKIANGLGFSPKRQEKLIEVINEKIVDILLDKQSFHTKEQYIEKMINGIEFIENLIKSNPLIGSSENYQMIKDIVSLYVSLGELLNKSVEGVNGLLSDPEHRIPNPLEKCTSLLAMLSATPYQEISEIKEDVANKDSGRHGSCCNLS